jgi:hypothetical protein
MNKPSPIQQSSCTEEDLAMSPNLKYYNRLPTRIESSINQEKIMCIKWPPSTKYMRGLLIRILTLIVIIGVLIGIGLGLLYTDGLPDPEDFSQLEFDWKINPGDYLTPFNSSFQYNVLLDGHSHTTYSDGKMSPRQLLDWHIGNHFVETLFQV